MHKEETTSDQELRRFLRSQAKLYPFGIPQSTLDQARSVLQSNLKTGQSKVSIAEFKKKVAQALSKKEEELIFGTGSLYPALMFVLVEPEIGSARDLFSGSGGALLKTAIEKGLKLSSEKVFISTLSKGLPLEQNEEKLLEILHEEITLVMPGKVVLMGDKFRKLFNVQAGERWGSVSECPALFTLDPIQVSKDESLKKPLWEDLKELLVKR